MMLQSYSRFNLLSLQNFLENVLVVFALDICRFFQCLATCWVQPILEYGSSVWDPYTDKLQEDVEKVQNRAARFVVRNCVYETGSMTVILGQLKLEPLKKRRKDNRLFLLYKRLKDKARIPTYDLLPNPKHGRNQHSLVFQISSASKDVYKYSIFPQAIRDWNDLHKSLISSPELSDDSVSKST